MSKFINIKNRMLLPLLLIPVLAVTVLWAKQGRANAPQGRYLIGDLTVTDNKTGLIWERDVSSSMISGINANAYCNNLALDGMKWRMPSMKELQTLVDESLANPAIDPIAFSTTTAGVFWTSSAVSPAGFDSWAIDFADGKTTTKALFGQVAYVRCVH